jgi:hypothetical protein
MVRRLVIAGFAAALIAPIYVTPSASATVLFTCPSLDSTESWIGFNPGWSHTQTAQDAWTNELLAGPTDCSNGQRFWVQWGTRLGRNSSVSFPPRPLGCPVAWGGAGPDYADRTPILFGPDGGSSAFVISWAAVPQSHGIFKAKAGPAGDEYRLVFNITQGGYAPPAGMKTKMKLTVQITPAPDWSYTCADDTDPLEYVLLTLVRQVVVRQK